MSFAPYIAFSGNAREAMTYYAEVFGATDLQIMEFADAPPDQRPSGHEGLVMHAQFSAGPGAPFMGCDVPQVYGTGGMGSSSVFHAARDGAEARRVFAALASGGQVSMELGATFWSPAFGMVTDRFGTRWMISLAPPHLEPEPP
ncbi:MAG: VOC family protein [Paracoccaceae bacterium]